LGSGFDAASGAIVLSAAILYEASSAMRVVPYPVMEVACFALIGLWLWLFEAHLRGLVSATAARDSGRDSPIDDRLPEEAALQVDSL
jgi:hypothetical protein